MSSRTAELAVLCACAVVSVLATAFGVFALWGPRGLATATATFLALCFISGLLMGVMASARRWLPRCALRRLGNVLDRFSHRIG